MNYFRKFSLMFYVCHCWNDTTKWPWFVFQRRTLTWLSHKTKIHCPIKFPISPTSHPPQKKTTSSSVKCQFGWTLFSADSLKSILKMLLIGIGGKGQCAIWQFPKQINNFESPWLRITLVVDRLKPNSGTFFSFESCWIWNFEAFVGSTAD